MVDDEEQVARLLFYPQMIRNGELEPSAFPMDELLAKKGKNGSSLDRCHFLKDRDGLLRQKAEEKQNPAGKRSAFGFCVANVGKIRAISEAESEDPALQVLADRITENDPPEPWDDAHALMRKHRDDYTRANLRGIRDHLSKAFSELVEFY
ncbi:hypothetical protein FLO80_21100 [Aquicoccus porphyridii]|uniref:Uncharacterized protein n=1 Tax=Aquicoccus porphyridii TaxID=1852029 RepID=A0A5A9YXG4_9RHOB|nr:hypothetical protein [Aquicoccus porphyridii]KAA0909530.1 hypothetical protein FLO80_21100 [Aquicoccus porphyridii]RAI51808.1 hypothetical protein DOO74_21210 [Rhodobacteraceae bacterium AsT-22]